MAPCERNEHSRPFWGNEIEPFVDYVWSTKTPGGWAWGEEGEGGGGVISLWIRLHAMTTITYTKFKHFH